MGNVPYSGNNFVSNYTGMIYMPPEGYDSTSDPSRVWTGGAFTNPSKPYNSNDIFGGQLGYASASTTPFYEGQEGSYITPQGDTGWTNFLKAATLGSSTAIAGAAFGPVIGGALGGALTSLAKSNGEANLGDLLKGAGTGAIAGYAGGSLGDFLGGLSTTTPEGLLPLDSFVMGGAPTQTFENYATNALGGTISDMALGTTNAISPGAAYLSGNMPLSNYIPQPTSINADPTLNVYTHPLDSFNLGGLPAETQPYNVSVAGNNVVDPYTNAASQDMFYRPSTSPVQIGTLGKIYDKEPSLISTLGQAALDNKDLIKKLANAFLKAGAPSIVPGVVEEAGGSRSTPDTEWLSNMITSGTGVGKSKGLLAGEVEGPNYNGESFMPGLKEIDKYNKQNLYYS
jgi:hypothetical protein